MAKPHAAFRTSDASAFRTRRRDECSRLQEGVRRRVRKSRQKEAAGAADGGLMQIEWSKRRVQKFTGLVKTGGGAVGAPVRRRVDVGSEPRRGQEEDVWTAFHVRSETEGMVDSWAGAQWLRAEHFSWVSFSCARGR
jgi:hypothetical protein